MTVTTFDPTDKSSEQTIVRLSDEKSFLDHTKPSVASQQNEEPQKLKYPILFFKKPERLSKKSPGTLKPEGSYCAVYNPNPLGTGAFGGVYPVIGVWKIIDGTATFKTKKTGETERLVKTNAPWNKDQINGNPFLHNPGTYDREQALGFWFDYMGFKYPPTHYENRSFVFMKKVPGISLYSLINKLKDNPDFLTATQKIQLSIELVNEAKRLHETNITNPDGTFSQIIHRDIKPENILVHLGPPISVRYIDFGLAKLNNNSRKEIMGTDLYMEPQLLEKKEDPQNPNLYIPVKETADIISDDFSRNRVITELWGDQSRDKLLDIYELLAQNYNIPLIGLFNKMTDLRDDEKLKIKDILKRMNSHESISRPSDEDILLVFQQLLDARIKLEERLTRTLKMPLEDIALDDLLHLLNHPELIVLFLEQLKNDRININTMVVRLGLRLLRLTPNALSTLKDQGMDLSHSTLIQDGLSQNQLTMEQLLFLAKTGAPVPKNYFQNFLKLPVTKKDWVTTCRILYHATPDRESVLAETDISTPFIQLYCKHFLKLNDASLDNNHKTQIERHLSNQAEMLKIRKILDDHFANTPLKTFILQQEPFSDSEKLSSLKVPYDLKSNLEKLIKLRSEAQTTKNQLFNQTGFNIRASVLKTLTDDLDNIVLENTEAWVGKSYKACTNYLDFKNIDFLMKEMLNTINLLSLLGTSIENTEELDLFYTKTLNTVNQAKLRALVAHSGSFLKALLAIKSCKENISQEQLNFTLGNSLPLRLTATRLADLDDTLVKKANRYSELYELITTTHVVLCKNKSIPNSSAFYCQIHTYFTEALKTDNEQLLFDTIENIRNFLKFDQAIKDTFKRHAAITVLQNHSLLFDYLLVKFNEDITLAVNEFSLKYKSILSHNLLDRSFVMLLNKFQIGLASIASNDTKTIQEAKKELLHLLNEYFAAPFENINALAEHKKLWGKNVEELISRITAKPEIVVSDTGQSFFNNESPRADIPTVSESSLCPTS